MAGGGSSRAGAITPVSAAETLARPARGSCADCGAEASPAPASCGGCGALPHGTALGRTRTRRRCTGRFLLDRREYGPDAAPCPWCAAANPPERHFCRRCGAQFTAPVEARTAPPPWWRRLPGGADGDPPRAGQRPRLRRRFGRTARLPPPAGLVVLFLVTGLIWTGPAVEAANDHFAERVADPVTVTASRSYEGHRPELATHRISDSWRGTGIEGDSAGEWLEAGLAGRSGCSTW